MEFNISFARRLCFVIACACALVSLRAQVRAPAPQLDAPETERRITTLLGEMTLEEKIGQLAHFADSSTGPGSPHPNYREQVAQGSVGSLSNITGVAETNALQKLAVENSRLHIPLVFALDVIHGYRTILPGTLGHGFNLGPWAKHASAGSEDPDRPDRPARGQLRRYAGLSRWAREAASPVIHCGSSPTAMRTTSACLAAATASAKPVSSVVRIFVSAA